MRAVEIRSAKAGRDFSITKAEARKFRAGGGIGAPPPEAAAAAGDEEPEPEGLQDIEVYRGEDAPRPETAGAAMSRHGTSLFADADGSMSVAVVLPEQGRPATTGGGSRGGDGRR